MFEFDLPTFPNWPCGMDADLMIGFFENALQPLNSYSRI